MNSPLSDEYQSMAANAICHAAHVAGLHWQDVAREYTRPSVVFKPKIYIDENQWCALYGESLQNGVCGFGDSPDEATYAFDKAWNQKLPNKN